MKDRERLGWVQYRDEYSVEIVFIFFFYFYQIFFPLYGKKFQNSLEVERFWERKDGRERKMGKKSERGEMVK